MRQNWVSSNINKLISETGVFCDGDWIESKDQDPNGDVRLIQLADIGDGNFRNKSSRFLTSKKANELGCSFLQNGDILIARMPDPLGRATFFPLYGNKHFVTVVDVAIIRPDNKSINTSYLLYSINSPQIRKKIESLQSGTTRKRISRKNFSKILFPIAPLPEQRAIVAKIEQLFSELDNGIAQFKTAQKKLDIYRQAVLKKAFEGELTKTWREQQSDLPTADELLQQIQQERQRHYQQQITDWEQAVKDWEMGGKDGRKPAKPRKLKCVEDSSKVLNFNAHDIPAYHWKWSHLGNIVKKVSDGPFGSNLKTADYVDNGIRVIRLENIKNLFFNNSKKTYITKEKYKLLKKFSVLPNDVIFSSFINENTSVASVPKKVGVSINKADCFCIKCGSSINHKYIEYFLSTRTTYNQLINLVHGATRPRVNTTQLKTIFIPLCSLQEQTQIVQAIESRLSVCDKLSDILKQQLEKAEALRQSILKKAFEGRLLTDAEIQTCQQQADWEPAEQLLARIKAESAEKTAAKPRKKQTRKKAN